MKFFKIIFLSLVLMFLYSCSSLNSFNSKSVKEDIVGNKFVMFAPYLDKRIAIEFSEDKITGFSGVNRFFGGYTIEGDSITIGPVASTMMAGPIEDMVKENFILSALNRADKIKFENNILIITTKENQNLKFNKIPLKTQ